MRKSLLAKYIEDQGYEEKKKPSGSKGKMKEESSLSDADASEQLEKKRYEIQCELNIQGASDLVVDLFMSDISNKVFKENVLLAIALLEGGNTQVQKTIYHRLLNDKNSEKFFKAFHDKIDIAQKEIKNMNSFMASDLNDGKFSKTLVLKKKFNIKVRQ
jgi:inositol 1,4,5-triphosphate receptor type 1